MKAICTLSAPLDLDATSRRLEELKNLPYRVYILRGLVTQGELFAQLHPELARYEPRSLRRLTSIREYDRRVIVPMHGFASVEDYYGRSSSGPYLHAIRDPHVDAPRGGRSDGAARARSRPPRTPPTRCPS